MALPHVRSERETVIAREQAKPAAWCVLHLLLRRGVYGYVAFVRAVCAHCDKVDRMRGATNAASTAATTTAATRTATTAIAAALPRVRRVNPEDVKAALHSCGVLLYTSHLRALLHAYSDSVGFVLADELLRAVAPRTHAPAGLLRCLWHALAPWSPHDEPTTTGATTAAPHTATVTLASAQATLAHLFSVTGDNNDNNNDNDNDGVSRVVVQRALQQAQQCFTAAAYADARVPVVDVFDFVAAQVLLLQQQQQQQQQSTFLPCAGVTSASACSVTANSNNSSSRYSSNACACDGMAASHLLQQRLCLRAASAPPLVPCEHGSASDTLRGSSNNNNVTTSSSSSLLHLSSPSGDPLRSSAAATHPTHTFARYTNADRRDEWLRGRAACAARPTYQRHAVGYAGHLPEYTRRFGRTFHIIEESLPQLGKQHVQQQQQQQQQQGDEQQAPRADDTPAAAQVTDGSDARIELKYSRMNQHHFTFA